MTKIRKMDKNGQKLSNWKKLEKMEKWQKKEDTLIENKKKLKSKEIDIFGHLLTICTKLDKNRFVESRFDPWA